MGGISRRKPGALRRSAARALVVGSLLAGGTMGADGPRPAPRPGPPTALSTAARTATAADARRAPIAPAAHASNGAEWSIAELERLALAHNPTLAQAARRVQALRGKHLQAGLYPNPVVGYEGEEIGHDGRAGQQGIFVGQPIMTAGKLQWDRTVVGREIAAAEHQWAMQRLRVANDVRVAAHRVLAAQRTVELSERLLEIGRESLRAAEQLFEAKEVSRVDVLETRIEANTARLELNKARHALSAQWRSLAAVTGVPGLPQAPLQDPGDPQHEPLDWDAAMARLLVESPERMRAVAEVERARAALSRACAGRVPDFELEAGVRYDFASEETLTTVGVALPLQLFDRNQGNIARAQAEVAAARQEIRRVELSLRDRLADEFRHYLDARETVAQYRELILPDADAALTLVREGYAQGELGYLDLLTAQQTYFGTHLAFVEALRDVQVSRIRIKGLLLAGGLERPDE